MFSVMLNSEFDVYNHVAAEIVNYFTSFTHNLNFSSNPRMLSLNSANMY